MAQTVGEIGLDLVINQNQYQQQLKGITSIAKKAGAVLVAAFSIKKIGEFGKECLELGSDLQEVQNVVDVTFPGMTAQVDKFAKGAATSFGLSETMAKKFTGTFGAMAKAFGFSEKEAYQMGSTLTGLAGDVASFYNISQDEAYTKLKSVFTGETETLKDLGIVMTQNALDAYAMANGYGKTTKAMSEAEKVALRYAFVQDQLSAASGDFARTSDSWANQVRILSLQFDSLKASIGQGLINLFTPVIKVINTVIGKLSVLANAFRAFTELITGKKAKAGVSAVADTATEGFSSASGAAEDLSNSTSGVGKAAKKAAKEMRALMGFDQIQKLDDTNSDESSSGGSGGSSGGGAGGLMDFGTLSEGETVVDKMDQSMSGLIKRVKELAGLFKKGFLISFGDSGKNIQQIKKSLKSIKGTLKEIFTSKEVVEASRKWTDAVALNLGKVTGAVAEVAVAIATNLTSGVAQSLEEKKDFIKSKLVSILTLNAEVWNVTGDFAVALGDIISGALTDPSAINISSDICSIFITGVLEGAELFAKAGLDLTKFIAQPIIDNKDKIETAIRNTLKPVSGVVNTLKIQVEDAFKIINKAYDEHIHPMFSKLTKGFSDSLGKFLDSYNKNIVPVLDSLEKGFKELYENHIKPYMEQIGGLVGTLADSISSLYEKIVKPFIDWCITMLFPVLAPAIEGIGQIIQQVFGVIADVASGIIESLRGIITFLTGVFTGDWTKAWEGIKLIFSGVTKAIGGIWSGLKSIFKTVLDTIKSMFAPIGGWFKSRFKEAVDGIHEVFSGIGSWFGSKASAIKEKFADTPEYFKKKFDAAWSNVKKAFSSVGSFFGGIWTTIKNKFTDIGQKVGDSVADAFKKAINAVLSNAERVLNKPINAINGMIDKVPGLGEIGKLKPFDLPRLAQGGYVKKNTPQLAMIGDNRHQGEVVAPEDKLREMAMLAAREAGMSGGVTKEELESIVNNAVMRIVSALYSLGFHLDGEQLAKAEKVIQKGLDRRFNTTEVV